MALLEVSWQVCEIRAKSLKQDQSLNNRALNGGTQVERQSVKLTISWVCGAADASGMSNGSAGWSDCAVEVVHGYLCPPG